MRKNYTQWHGMKTTIEHEHKARLFREQEVWRCSLGENIGFEQDGKNSFFERPVLILRKFNKELFWGVPMTSKKKEGVFYYSFSFHK
jgi:mRNA interferase MazF